MMPRNYPSPEAFKAGLEQRLRNAVAVGSDLARARQLLVFQRFLARVAEVLGERVILKGGLVLELRLDRARTTKDIDLRVVGDPGRVLEELQLAGRENLGDFMTYEVQRDEHHAEIQGDGMRYEGVRFRAECRLAGKLYGQRFGVDVAFGDPLTGEPDTVVAEDLLAFAGVTPPTLRLYPVETHIAEKLHAYTLPRSRPNSRIKDLPDLGLLARVRTLRADRLGAALEQTFSFRGTHPLPSTLPPPPDAWREPYAALAREDQLVWVSIDDVTRAAEAFLNPVLAGARAATWHPDRWTWHADEPASTPRPRRTSRRGGA